MIGFPIREDDLLIKHQNGIVLVDTNLLLLYLVGKADPRIIPRFMRTQKYTIEDFQLLSKLLETFFRALVTTPNVLTEVSNLVTKLSENERPGFFDQMKRSVAILDETYCPSRTAVEDRNYRTFGLTDATILSIRPDVLVLTDDLPLYQLLSSRGRDVINFNHIIASPKQIAKSCFTMGRCCIIRGRPVNKGSGVLHMSGSKSIHVPAWEKPRLVSAFGPYRFVAPRTLILVMLHIFVLQNAYEPYRGVVRIVGVKFF